MHSESHEGAILASLEEMVMTTDLKKHRAEEMLKTRRALIRFFHCFDKLTLHIERRKLKPIFKAAVF
jgi:hypothetical protein